MLVLDKKKSNGKMELLVNDKNESGNYQGSKVVNVAR